jgi:hypothetical protein
MGVEKETGIERNKIIRKRNEKENEGMKNE